MGKEVVEEVDGTEGGGVKGHGSGGTEREGGTTRGSRGRVKGHWVKRRLVANYGHGLVRVGGALLVLYWCFISLWQGLFLGCRA